MPEVYVAQGNKKGIVSYDLDAPCVTILHTLPCTGRL